jgi:DNA-binding SARP family transcriptional activator
MIKVHALGESVIYVDSTRVTPSAERSFAFLLYLSLHRGRRIPRAILHEMVFPSYDEDQASHCLRQLLYQQRTTGAPIDASAGGLLLPTELVSFDFDALLESPEPPNTLLDAAEGGVFPGYLPSHSESFAEWFEGQREQMTLQVSRSLAEAAKRARAISDRPRCERIARVALRLDPFNRDATLALAQMLALGGARSEANRILERYAAEVGGPVPKLEVAGDPANLFGERAQRERRQSWAFTFAGRTEEMLRLNDALNAARSNECQRVLIFGEPGIGKTRLVSEFCSVATLSGARTAAVSLQPSDQHRPFGAFADLLPSLLAMPGAMQCPQNSLSLLRRRLSAGRISNREPVTELPEADLGERLVAASTDLIDAVSGDRVLILAFEDIQWLDEGSARALASLARGGCSRKLVVLLSSRQQTALEWLGGETVPVMSIGLAALPSKAVAQMLVAVQTTSGLRLDGELCRWLEETAQGNPLFLESLLTHYVRTRERFSVPPTLLALLDRRIDLLSPDATTTLQICALLGKHSSLETIARSIALPQFALLQAISDLEARGLVRIEGSWVQPSHALIADRALCRMGPIQTQMSHRCVATALDTLAEQTPSLLWACAEHWTLARDQERARASLNSCVEYAKSIGRPRDAARILRQALSVDLFADDLSTIAHEMVRTADLAGEPEFVLEGIALISATGQPRLHNDIEFAEIRAEARMFRGTPAERQRLFECATAIGATPDHRITAAIWILKYADMHGDAALAQTAIDAIDATIIRQAATELRSEFDLVSACVLGHWDKAASVAREILNAIAPAPPSTRIVPRLNASLTLWRAGESSEAIDASEKAYADAQSSGSYRLGLTVAATLADMNLDLGQSAAANMWIEQALVTATRFPETESHFALWMIRILGSISDKDISKAKALFGDAQKVGIFNGSELRERWRSALEARVSLLHGKYCLSEQELFRLTNAIDEAHPMSGALDFEIATACEYLVSSGRCSEARDLCDHFRKSPRRNRAVLPQEIRRVAALIDEAAPYPTRDAARP